MQTFLPFNANVDLAIAGASVVIFSGFILYDTQQIMKRLSVDEWVLASLSLYLDAVNLFISVLRVVRLFQCEKRVRTDRNSSTIQTTDKKQVGNWTNTAHLRCLRLYYYCQSAE